MKKYKINEIFYSLQGEGINIGKPVVFIRFSSCNLNCSFCDTDKTTKHAWDINQIGAILLRIAPKCRAVIFTGGEPLLQLDGELVSTLKEHGYWLGLETNGTLRPVEGLDYITVSPKEYLDHWFIDNAVDELRMPFSADKGIDKHLVTKARHYCISPIFDSKKLNKHNLQAAIRFCLDNPEWRLSVQNHKLWRIK